MSVPKLALVLSGGGARAAYQTGVLAAIAARRPEHTPNPFAIICGTSAGAINATAIAAGAVRFRAAADRLRRLWSGLHVGDIYDAGTAHLLKNSGRWLASFVPGFSQRRPVSLLDNNPLAALLSREIPFDHIRGAINVGYLDALTVTAGSYRTGTSVSFCAARPENELWERAQRIGVHATIGVQHLIASSAIPFVFPPALVDGEYYGDGAIRQVAPTAPALHLGADRILVVGAARSSLRHEIPLDPHPPSIAAIGGHVLASVFTDALGTDLEKVRLINAAVRQIDPARLAQSPVPLRDVRLLVITPSISLEKIAFEHAGEMPRMMRALLARVGGNSEQGSELLSYLLFEPGYTNALIELGWQDANAKAAEIDAFFDGVPATPSVLPRQAGAISTRQS